MVAAARSTGISHNHVDDIALAADAVIGACVADPNPTAAVRRLVLVVHVVVTEGHNEGIVAVGDTAGARCTIGRVDCSDAAMEDEVVSVSRAQRLAGG